MLFDIRGKYDLITGANRGLGLGIARGYAQAGANLILVGRHMPLEVLEELQGYGVQAEFFPLDLSHPEEIPPLVRHVLERWERIDILFNNAGTQRRNPCVDYTDEDWDFVHNVNEKSVFVMCREVGRHMIAQGGGKIINIASLLSFQGGLNGPAYAATKGAVAQFTKTLSNEWIKLGVNVNCIAPGYFATEINVPLMNDPSRGPQITSRIPAGRWGKPEDLVGTAIYLASSASDYVSGVTIPVDGGWLGY